MVVFYQSNSRITNTRLLFILFVLRQASLEHVLIINPFAIVSECLQLFPFPTALRLQVKAAAQQALTQLSHLLVFRVSFNALEQGIVICTYNHIFQEAEARGFLQI